MQPIAHKIVDSIEYKRCSACKQWKVLDEFSKESRRRDSLADKCKHCKGILHKKYRIKHLERISTVKKQWSVKNPDYDKQYMSNPANKARRNARVKHRLKNDVGFKLVQNLRIRVSKVIRGHTKSASTIQLLGCSTAFLKTHLEQQFTAGMTWENYGEWHVDHIKPCTLFDLSRYEEQQACFHYTNLQPLWAKDNISKGNRYTI